MIRVWMLLLMPLLLFADIDAEIEAIQNAPIKERFKLMNAFKQKLIKMRELEREKAIKKLTAKTENAHPSDTTKKEIAHEIENGLEDEIDTEIENHEQREDDD